MDDFVRTWGEGGRDAAFALVEKLFTDPANQKRKGKPTDFLHDDDDEADDSPAARRRREREATKKPSAAAGFQQFVEGFRPKRKPAALARWILERLEESREEDRGSDEAHPFQPWNQLELQLGHYERLDCQVRSMYAAGDRRVQQFGLHHEIISASDTHEEYTFTYDLGHEDEIVLRYGDEVVPGKIAHGLAKAAIYAPYLRETIDALISDERFARIPKAFPFRFRFRSHQHADYTFDLELAPALDEAALASHPLREVYRAAATVPEVTRDQRFHYYLTLAHRADSAAKAELVAIVRGAPDILQALKAAGEDSIARTRALDAYGRDTEKLEQAVKGDARLEEVFGFRPYANPDSVLAAVRARGPSLVLVIEILQAIGETAAARALTRARFEVPAPTWSAHGDDQTSVAEHHMTSLQELLAIAPADERAELDQLYGAMLDRLASGGDPMVTLSILEARVTPEQTAVFDKDTDEDGEDNEDNDDADDGEPHEESEDEDDDDDKPNKAVALGDLGPPPFDQSAFDDLPVGAKVLVTEGSPRYIDAVVASIAVREYGRITDQTASRLKALGLRARAAEPTLRAFLTEMCSDGYNHDSEVATLAEILWQIGAEDVPDEVHKAHKSNEFYMEEFYPKWAKAAPARKLQRLLGALRAEPSSAASPRTWEDGIYDSAPAFAMYRDAITSAPERDAWIDGLVRAVGGANDLVFRFVRDWGREVSRKNQPLARTLLEAVEAKLTDETSQVTYGYNSDNRADTARLRRARLHGLAHLLDTDAPEAPAELARLHARYPGDATIEFLTTMRVGQQDGPRLAGERTIAHARRMSEDDIVYAKAFFQYTRTQDERWESVDVSHAFAMHDIAERAFRKSAWTDGKLDDNPRELDEDPLFEGMYDEVSQLADADLDAALAGYRRAVAVLAGSPADLASALDSGNWELSWLVAKQLARAATPDIAKLVEVFGWFADDKHRRRLLYELIWPLPGATEALLADATFRSHLGEFIQRYPRPSDALAREIFAHFAARGEDEHIVATMESLDMRTVIAVMISIMGAYVRLRRFDDAVVLLEKARKEEVKPKQPEWVLISANIAAMQAQAGKLDAAEATLADLFARDWSRFEYTGGTTDAAVFSAKYLGGDLNAKYTSAWRRYWAQAKFNAGCLHALRGRAAESLDALRDAIRYAPDAYPAAKLLAEKDLVSLSNNAEFKQLLSELPPGGAA